MCCLVKFLQKSDTLHNKPESINPPAKKVWDIINGKTCQHIYKGIADNYIIIISTTTRNTAMAEQISGIGAILSQFTQKQDKQWVTEARRHRIAVAARNIIHYDSELSFQTRGNYDIDLIIPQFQNDMDTVVQIVKRRITDSINREADDELMKIEMTIHAVMAD